jgi:heme/copper-type cytochrome/quinol oxidase subunit 2
MSIKHELAEMKKMALNNGNKINLTNIPIILLAMISMYSTGCTQRLEGWKDLYLFNCSADDITIETSLKGFEKEIIRFYQTGPYESEPPDTISLNERIYYYQWLLKTKSYKETGDTLLIILEPQEGMRIINLEWLIAPTKFRERDLTIDNLRILTKSDTLIARNRKEILQLRFDRRCKDGIYFKTIKYGRHGTPVMNEKVWKGRI